MKANPVSPLEVESGPGRIAELGLQRGSRMGRRLHKKAISHPGR
jgi:hypothetical protein